jgi:hypothetical protein
MKDNKGEDLKTTVSEDSEYIVIRFRKKSPNPVMLDKGRYIITIDKDFESKFTYC